MARLFFTMWPFTTMKICPIAWKIAKVDSKYCQLLNESSKTCQRLLKYRQSSKKLLNLDTLIAPKAVARFRQVLDAQIYFLKNGPIPASFCLFSLFSHYNFNNWKSIDGVLGIRTRGRRMVGADETTELWRPLRLNILMSRQTYHYLLSWY